MDILASVFKRICFWLNDSIKLSKPFDMFILCIVLPDTIAAYFGDISIHEKNVSIGNDKPCKGWVSFELWRRKEDLLAPMKSILFTEGK